MARNPTVKTGLDVLAGNHFDGIAELRVAVLTNQAGVTQQLEDSVSLLARASGVDLAAVFAPEHGLLGVAQAGVRVPDDVERRTGLPVYSLYGDGAARLGERIAELDAVIVDLQDVGVRYYTYAATLAHVLRTAAETGARVVVLDRPNPLGGTVVEGLPAFEESYRSLVAFAPVPIRHGLTFGELARWLVRHEGIPADLDVVAMEGWRRSMNFTDTGLPWVPPSPNLPTPEAVQVYPGTCLLEGTNVSEGRGTAHPFELLGAPWLDGHALADRLKEAGVPGVAWRPAAFVPTFSKYEGERCEGVQIHVTRAAIFRPVWAGLTVVETLLRGWTEFEFTGRGLRSHFDLLLGTSQVRMALLAGASTARLAEGWEPRLRRFHDDFQEVWLYD